MYAVIATDSVAARGLVNGWCLPRSGRGDILSVAITAFILIGVILRIIIKNFKQLLKQFLKAAWNFNKLITLHRAEALSDIRLPDGICLRHGRQAG